ncbi:hypothetical protein QVD17_25401 [Tagetes erecta]|uniref:Poly [ADP-ribose] polymerase n=1 Tax=Tagetes erecta TaxID=13708 RepID=A0AAD8KGN2_TARER|nr:hypothetical protein QVD17_25401 [Tagetes erecta]
MPRLSPAVVDRKSIDYEQTSSSFGSDNDVYKSIPNIDEDYSSSSTSSDCESVTNSVDQHTPFELNGLVRLDESDKLHEMIRNKFVSRMNQIGIDVHVQSVDRNLFNANAIAQARLISFQIYAKSVQKKNNGDANVKCGWFGGSKDEISKIVMYGFGSDNVQKKNGGFGHGIVLSADYSPLESVESAIADEDGIKHILLCRVLMGKSELVNRGSTQCYPSSDGFQSGVDDLSSPTKLVVWSSQMNTHILPEFVISFKTTTSINRPKSYGVHVRVEKPVSPWIPIPDLIAALSKILAPKAIKEITQFRRSYIERKICRRDMIQGIRSVTGDRLLMMVLKDFTQQRRSNRPS